MSKYTTFLFDLDGVLCDTAKFHYMAWRRMAQEFGYDFSEEKNEELKGVGRMESLNKILAWAGVEKSDEDKERLAQQKNEWYIEYIQDIDHNELLPGVKDFLIKTQEAGIKIGLGSASRNAIPILEKLGIIKYFEALIDGNKAPKSKPDPQVFLLGAEETHTPPEQCVVFEDSLAGIEAAKAAGMATVGVGHMLPKNVADFHVGGLEFITPGIIIEELEKSNY